MGGGIVLTYAALAPATISPHIMGYILNAPLLLLGPASAPSAALRFILSVASRVLPSLQLPQKVDPEVVSRDPEVQKAFKEDKLAPGIGTPEGLWGMLERGRELMDGKVRVDVGRRVWIGHGTGDTLTSWEASRRWVEEVFSGGTDKEIRLFEGWRHKRSSLSPRHSLFLNLSNTSQL
jgi:acylglycerol lipase